MLNKDFSDSISMACVFINLCLFMFGVFTGRATLQLISALNVLLFFTYYLFSDIGRTK